MKNQDEEYFCEVACKVFDTDGSIRLCGRDAVSTLIEAAEQIDSTRNFGDKEIGRMNVDTVRELLEEVKKKG